MKDQRGQDGEEIFHTPQPPFHSTLEEQLLAV